MATSRVLTAIVLSACIAALSACDSSEERAEKHYQSGLEYLAAGDVDRALVEFRNVFKLNGGHKDARRTYAEAERKRGRLREAFSQYLRLAEQYPDDLDAARALAEIAADGSDWDTAGRFAATALELAPGDTGLQAIRIAADYGRALAENDVSALVASSADARAMRETLPDNLLLRRVIIDDHIRAEDYGDALRELDSALALSPNDRTLLAQRLSVHAARGDEAAVEAGLKDMVERFPEAPEMATTLVRWYVARSELDKAEGFLRVRVASAQPDQDDVFALVGFLAEQRGQDVAVAELERVIAAAPDIAAYRAAHAAFIFDLGRRDEAIANMRALLDGAPPSHERRNSKVALAKMLSITGNDVGARALVEEVLSEDAGEVEALKLKAGWLILDDSVGDAIAILRRALDQNPRDAGILTLMAQAYERDGNYDLVRETLALAVAAANRAPAESLRYAQFLAREDRFIPAEGVLIDALRLSPGNPALLVPLGDIYLHVQDWPRAEAVAVALEATGGTEARRAAQNIRATSLLNQEDTDQAIDYLQKLVDDGAGGLAAQIAILRTHLDAGANDKALAYSATLLARAPEDRDIRFIDATVRALAGDAPGAETVYRQLVEQDQQLQPAWMALARLVAADPARIEEATGIVEQGIAALPDSAELQWAKAGLLERNGDYDGAIAIYETLYTANSANPIIANNLASLLSNHRSDPDSIARAEVIARRLRNSPVAPYQDTYGWIAHLRGRHDEAIRDLEKASTGLGDDPVVQYHLAMAYLAVGRKSEAAAQFQKALALAGPDDSRPFVTTTRDQLAQLEAEGIAIGN